MTTVPKPTEMPLETTAGVKPWSVYNSLPPTTGINDFALSLPKLSLTDSFSLVLKPYRQLLKFYQAAYLCKPLTALTLAQIKQRAFESR